MLTSCRGFCSLPSENSLLLSDQDAHKPIGNLVMGSLLEASHLRQANLFPTCKDTAERSICILEKGLKDRRSLSFDLRKTMRPPFSKG